MMRKIIVPTDFSENAKHAAQIAVELANRFSADVTLMHVFYPATELNTGFSIDPGLETTRRSHLDNLASELRESMHDGLEIATEFILGMPIQEIALASHQADTFVVMGTIGKSKVLGRILGSVSSEVAKQAQCPVLLIPHTVKAPSFSQVLYATDGSGHHQKIEHEVVQWLSHFEPVLHIAKVDSRDEEEVTDLDSIFQKVPFKRTVRVHIRGNSIADTLNQYAINHDIDLIILLNQRRSFWHDLFHTSVTKEMALRSSLPILVMHEHSLN